MESEDQAIGSTGQTGAEGNIEGEATQSDQDQEQSSGDQTSTKPKSYHVGGRDLTPDELYDKHVALEKDYTQKSQRLARMERSF